MAAPPVLRAEAIWKWYGHLPAVSDVSFGVRPGEIVGLIGPDRSGRSTIVNMLAGQTRPTSGRFIHGGEDITHLTPEARTRRGITSTPKPAHLFADLTALENVLMSGAICQRPMFPRRGGKSYRDEARSMLDAVGLHQVAERPVSELSPTQQSFLTIAVAMTAKPSLLLLDEPAAGMFKTGRTALGRLIGRIRDDGASVLLTGYRLQPLMEVCDRLLVLSEGKIIAEDSPSLIITNPAVTEAYMRTQ